MQKEDASKIRVLIVGAGVAGLSLAHELSRVGGYDITIVEQNEIFGGKARSARMEDGNRTEHSLRFFPPSYEHMFTLMKEIKFADQTAYENLEYGCFVIEFRGKMVKVDFKYDGFLNHMRKALRIFKFFHSAGVTLWELVVFIYKIGRQLWLTTEEIETQLEPISLENYLGGADRTAVFHDLILRLPEMFVAAKRHSSAAVVSRVLLEFFIGPFLKSKHNRLGIASLQGPTSELLIDPWVEHLKQCGVKFRSSVKVEKIIERARRITGVKTKEGELLEADITALALPHNILRALLGDKIDRYSGLEALQPLGEEWANGMQYVLSEIPENCKKYLGCATVVADSPWSLDFAIYTRDGWPGIELPPETAAILTVAASNSINPGIKHKKPFNRCTAAEILEEVLVQTGLPLPNAVILKSYLSPDLEYLSTEEFLKNESAYDGYGVRSVDNGKSVLVSDCLLYVRMPGNAGIEPDNRTEIGNLYIAGEFTRTSSKIPSMEKSVESGMRCAQAICFDYGGAYQHERLESADLPLPFLRDVRFRWSLYAVCIIVLAVFAIYALRMFLKL